MAFWVELRCDKRLSGRDPKHSHRNLCWSNDNSGPMGMYNSPSEARKDLSKEGVKCGWRKIDGDWICPGCMTKLAPATPLTPPDPVSNADEVKELSHE